MGRSCASVRQCTKDITDRWCRVAYRFSQTKEPCRQLADMAKTHSSEAFFGCDDPLESVIFSSLLELLKLQDGDDSVVDP